MAGSAIIGASVISAASGSKSAKRAAKAQQAATEATIDESRRQFDTVQENTAVQRTAGDAAMFRLANLLGIELPGRHDFTDWRHCRTGTNPTTGPRSHARLHVPFG